VELLEQLEWMEARNGATVLDDFATFELRYFPPFEWIVYHPGLLSISPYAWPFSSAWKEREKEGRQRSRLKMSRD